MRIYYKTEQHEIFSEDFAMPLNNMADRILILMLEKMKYQIMWALRALEKEIDESEGILIIECESMYDKCRVSAKNFSSELAEKINDIAHKTKL